ncbi:hypothetical protein AB6A40_011322 [Gnathostoma spinigerum]|uniref:Uncharacterized protein n=1 Tax=Gnathostoma spinigerum TaxID=75299 RepID=A0ABD6F3B5_9BILA
MGEQKTVKNNKIGVLGAVSYIIGNIIGSGIFIAPTSVLIQTNSIGLSLVVWIVAGMIATLGSFCYVELGTSIRASGADFAYLCYVKAYPVAFAFMCVGCALQYPATVAIHSQTFSEYIFKGFDIELESETAQYFAKKLLGFSLIRKHLFAEHSFVVQL